MDSLERADKAKHNQSQQELGRLDPFDIHQSGESHLLSPKNQERQRAHVPKFLPPSLVSIHKVTRQDQTGDSEYSRTLVRKKVHHESVDFTDLGGQSIQQYSAA